MGQTNAALAYISSRWRAWLPPLLMAVAVILAAAYFVSGGEGLSLLYRQF